MRGARIWVGICAVGFNAQLFTGQVVLKVEQQQAPEVEIDSETKRDVRVEDIPLALVSI